MASCGIGFRTLISFPVAGLLIDEMPLGESVIISLVLSLVMLVMNLLRPKAKQPWEGVVVNKYSKIEYKHRDQAKAIQFTPQSSTPTRTKDHQ